MFQFNLRTHRVDAAYQKPHFFILNRGNKSGKLLSEPCLNCFVCICQSEQEKESLYWILFALWQGRRFHQVLCGSVIPFIRKKNFQTSSTRGKSTLSIFRINSVKISKPCSSSNKKKKNTPKSHNPSKN
jgi:hypothetical protein